MAKKNKNKIIKLMTNDRIYYYHNKKIIHSYRNGKTKDVALEQTLLMETGADEIV